MIACSKELFRLIPAASAFFFTTLFMAQDVRANARDYDPLNPEWNGLSDLMAMAQTMGLRVDHKTHIDFGKLDKETVLFFCYPKEKLPTAQLEAFLAAGGFLVIADDFGKSESFLSELSIQRYRASSLSLFFFHKNRPGLPLAFALRPDHPLAAGVDHLTTNHASFFSSSFRPVFSFHKHSKGKDIRAEVAVVLALSVGNGTLILISDSSLFINVMQRFSGNRAFARNLLMEMMAARKEALWMVAPDLSFSGTFPLPSSKDESKSRSRIRRAVMAMQKSFLEWNKYIMDLEYILPTAILFCGFILALLASSMPLSAFKYHGQWTRAGTPLLPDAYRKRFNSHTAKGNKDFTEAACLLRDHLDMELERRLGTASSFVLLRGRFLFRLVKTRFGVAAASLIQKLQPLLGRLPATDKLYHEQVLLKVSWRRLRRAERMTRMLIREMDRKERLSQEPSS